MNWQGRITTGNLTMAGKAVTEGPRVPVQVIVGSLARGMTLEAVCEE